MTIKRKKNKADLNKETKKDNHMNKDEDHSEDKKKKEDSISNKRSKNNNNTNSNDNRNKATTKTTKRKRKSDDTVANQKNKKRKTHDTRQWWAGRDWIPFIVPQDTFANQSKQVLGLAESAFNNKHIFTGIIRGIDTAKRGKIIFVMDDPDDDDKTREETFEWHTHSTCYFNGKLHKSKAQLFNALDVYAFSKETIAPLHLKGTWEVTFSDDNTVAVVEKPPSSKTKKTKT